MNRIGASAPDSAASPLTEALASSAVVRMFDRAIEELGPLEGFVSNAGVINKAAPLVDLEVEEIERIIRIDLTAHLICNREAVRRMMPKNTIGHAMLGKLKIYKSDTHPHQAQQPVPLSI